MEFDFVIVGAGIAGASLAYELAPHARVAVLEQESQPGYHSTGRSAALFSETYGTPTIRGLTCASRTFLTSPPPGFAEHPILSERGVMHVAMRGQEHDLAASMALARQTAVGAIELDAAQTIARCPVLRADAVLGAVYEHDAMDIDVHALHNGYLKGMRARGGQLFNDARLASASFADGVWTIKLDDGRTVAGRMLVNAAGAWADVVAARCGVPPVGLQPKRRTAFTFDPPAGVSIAGWPTVIGIDESYYFKPDAGQLLGSPANADPVDPHDVQAEEIDVATGIFHIEEVSTMRIRRPTHVWAGLRSFVGDGDLVVGHDELAPGFFWVAAQGGYGIQSAPAVARLAASALLGQAFPEDLARFGVRADALAPARLQRMAHPAPATDFA
ncbi:FAD-dependent oxidoreductase [Noviherbaspirillum sp. 1P10PC]|uniref:NAD(P)/FAD-dependent oxidoreductase n=1 Tax=Noviherbaspirillum sp. 1P10PC TaxID=3132292 RepID=UPI00399F408D